GGGRAGGGGGGVGARALGGAGGGGGGGRPRPAAPEEDGAGRAALVMMWVAMARSGSALGPSVRRADRAAACSRAALWRAPSRPRMAGYVALASSLSVRPSAVLASAASRMSSTIWKARPRCSP